MDTAQIAALSLLERAINYALSLDPGSRLRLNQLQGSVFQFECTAPAINTFAIIEIDKIRLAAIWEEPVTAHVKGSGSDYRQLLLSKDPASELINGKIELHGKSEGLIELQKIVKDLDIDWEAPIANLFGDIAGHQLAQGLRHGFQLLGKTAEHIKTQLQKNLHEENAFVATASELDQFYADIADTTLRTERLQARITALQETQTS